MLFKYLSSQQLQEGIGAEILEALEALLPAVTKGEVDDSNIYRHENLIRLYKAFANPDTIAKAQFLRTALGYLPYKEMISLAEALELPEVSSDYEELKSDLIQKAEKGVVFKKRLLSSLGFGPEAMPQPKAKLPVFDKVARHPTPLKTLKDYQCQIFFTAISKLENNLARFIIQLPTGAGKTRTAMEVIASFLNSAETKQVVVWVAHSEELCDQAIQCFKEVWSHLGISDADVVRCFSASGALPLPRAERSFYVCGFQKLYSLLKKEPHVFAEIRQLVTLIVVDEAHKVIAPTYKETVHALRGDETRLIGLTATPGRSAHDSEQNRQLAEHFFNEIVTITPPANETVFGMLRQRRILAKIQYAPLVTGLTFALSERDLKYLEANFDFPRKLLEEMGAHHLRNLEIVKRLQAEATEGASILFFACSVEHSKFINSTLLYLGIPSGHIDGGTSSATRTALIEQFRAKQLRVLCNFGVLSTGFDAPNTDVVFISRPTKSIVLYSQMVGRGLRGPAIGGTPLCKLIDVKDNILGLPQPDEIYDYFAEYFET